MKASNKTAIHMTPISGRVKDYWLVEFDDGETQLFDNEDEAIGVFDLSGE